MYLPCFASRSGGPKKVALPITVMWPTVMWNLARVAHRARKKRIWRTATKTLSTVTMWPAEHAMPRSSAFASS